MDPRIFSAMAMAGREEAAQEAQVRNEVFGKILAQNWEALDPEQRQSLWGAAMRVPKATGFMQWGTQPLEVDPKVFQTEPVTLRPLLQSIAHLERDENSMRAYGLPAGQVPATVRLTDVARLHGRGFTLEDQAARADALHRQLPHLEEARSRYTIQRMPSAMWGYSPEERPGQLRTRWEETGSALRASAQLKQALADPTKKEEALQRAKEIHEMRRERHAATMEALTRKMAAGPAREELQTLGHQIRRLNDLASSAMAMAQTELPGAERYMHRAEQYLDEAERLSGQFDQLASRYRETLQPRPPSPPQAQVKPQEAAPTQTPPQPVQIPGVSMSENPALDRLRKRLGQEVK